MTTQSPFPRRLKQARSFNKLTQKELGIRAGIDESSASPRMNQYENGVHSPDFQTVERIAKQLNIPSCYLYCVEDDVAELLLTYSRLDSEEKKKLLMQIKQQKITESG